MLLPSEDRSVQMDPKSVVRRFESLLAYKAKFNKNKQEAINS